MKRSEDPEGRSFFQREREREQEREGERERGVKKEGQQEKES